MKLAFPKVHVSVLNYYSPQPTVLPMIPQMLFGNSGSCHLNKSGEQQIGGSCVNDMAWFYVYLKLQDIIINLTFPLQQLPIQNEVFKLQLQAICSQKQ